MHSPKPLDPRVNAFRPDLADISLRDQVQALNYAEPTLRQCMKGVLPMLDRPDPVAQMVSQIRYGEFVDVFEDKNGFAWVQNRSDRYVGYIPSKGALGDSIAMMSNRVITLRTFVYPEPDLKAPPIDELTLGSFAGVTNKKGDFFELANGGFVFAGHVRTAEFADTPDYVFTAGRLLHTPYLWGGRTPKGIDCSGFVQLALEIAGIDCPRDSDQQRDAFARPLDAHWRDLNWKRGDIVFFLGSGVVRNHVGIMTGTDHIIHANGHAMEVTVEPLIDVVMRGNEIIAAAFAKDLQG